MLIEKETNSEGACEFQQKIDCSMQYLSEHGSKNVFYIDEQNEITFENKFPKISSQEKIEEIVSVYLGSESMSIKSDAESVRFEDAANSKENSSVNNDNILEKEIQENENAEATCKIKADKYLQFCKKLREPNSSCNHSNNGKCLFI